MDMQSRNFRSKTINRPPGMNANKVYINPNFSIYRAAYTALPENTSMHFNPKFSNQTPLSNTNNTRIFINPNFVKLAQGHTSSEPVQIIPFCNNVKKSIELNIEPKKFELNAPNVNVNKSRYSLVRQGTVKETVQNKLPSNSTEPSKTIKINKYKSVSITDIKTRLMKEHNSVQVSPNLRNIKVLPPSQEYRRHPGHIKKIINRYKYVKCKSTSVSYDSNKRVIKNKANIAAVKKNYKLKIKDAKKVFKKNNIPCPLFKKFGKCIRNIHGNCEFLHDKKHVALCRKFLKGICVNTECLLSHDVTNEKMPTCHFYLKGMCTKENCPYVHIKLNDDTKICPEFLKGYCEKGNKCTDRHITVASNTKKPYMKNKKLKIRKKSICLENKPKADNKLNENQSNKKEENLTEGRYYEDQAKWDDNTNDEVIKPTRCKLGSLPSFIQLHN